MTDISYGTGLFAVEQGSGAPIVYLHGGLADHRAVLHRLGALATTHRLIAPDARAAGRSHYGGDLSWDLYADDVAALLDHLGLEQAAIGGVSSGSAIAVRFSLRYPKRTTKLVIQWPVFAGRQLTDAQRTAMYWMNVFGQKTLVEGIAALEPLFGTLPPEIRDAAIGMSRSFDPASVAATTRFLDSGAQPFATLADLAVLAMPVLVVPGVDPQHPPELAAEYARAIPHAVIGEDIAGFLQS